MHIDTDRPSIALALLVALSAAGCTRDDASQRAKLASRFDETPSALARKAPEEILLDLAADGSALVGRVLPELEDSDRDRYLSARILRPDGASVAVLAGAALLEARFVPGSPALLIISTAHELRRLEHPSAVPVTLELKVYGPMSFSLDGRRVVYTRGEPPELVTVLRDLATGSSELPAPGLVPAWCPTLSHDGREIVLVSSVDGTPGLFRVAAGSPPAPWLVAPGTPLPTGPSAAVLYGDALVFEDEAGVHSLGLDGSLRRTLPGLHGPVLDPSRARLFVGSTPAGTVTTRIDALALEGPR